MRTTIVPPPTVNFDASTTALATAQQRLQRAFAELSASPNPTGPKAVAGVPKTKYITKREPVKNVATHRAAPPLNIAPPSGYALQAEAPSARMSLLETLKERLGQTKFKLN